MSTTQAAEYRAIREILQRRNAHRAVPMAKDLITVSAVIAAVGLAAAVVPGLLWFALLAAIVLTLGA